MRAVWIALIVLAALPATAFAQLADDPSVTTLTAPTPELNLIRAGERKLADAGPARKSNAAHPTKPKAAVKTARRSKPTKTKGKLSRGGAVPRFTFQQRAARSFDPLSLTLEPDTASTPAGARSEAMAGSFAAANRGQVAVAPSDPTDRITSAGIENMAQGNNHTIVVPLFELLNKLSNQPPPAP